MQQQQLKRSKKVYKTKREILEELWRLFNTHTHTHTHFEYMHYYIRHVKRHTQLF